MKIEKRGRMISAARVRKLLVEKTFVVATDLQERVPGKPLLLQDGQIVLVFEDGRGTLYPSRDALVDLMERAEELVKQGPIDPKQTLLPPVDVFIDQVKEHASRLAGLLGIHHSLDGSGESLRIVDMAVYKLSKEQRMSPEVVSSLVAYVGEILRSATSGSWTTISPSPRELEPVVVGQNGVVLQPFAIVYGELLRGRRGSLQGATNGVLGAVLVEGQA
ncbi:MAG TPA: hypothetical protein VK539_03795 [Myxococcaceae bacterium]|nr:hypothetical protein [Myxococcaceae bacterium]